MRPIQFSPTPEQLAAQEQRRTRMQAQILRLTANGTSYEDAFDRVNRRMQTEFANAKANPIPGHKLAKDGSLVLADGSATDKELMVLGLPSTATREQIHIFRVAKASETSPEAAAVAVKLFIQAAEAADGLNLHEAWEKAAEYWPDVMKAALSAKLV